MPVRKKLREFRKSFSSRLDALLPSQTDVQSAGLLPRARASDSALGPSTHQADLRTERKPQDAFQGDITNRKLQIPTSPPALLVTQPTGEVASVSQQPSTSDLGHLGGQPAIPHAPVVAFNVDTIASTGPGQSTSTSSWVNLKTFSRVLDQNKGVFGPLRGVIAELVGCIEIYENVASGRDEFKTLQNELEGLFEGLRQHISPGTPLTITASIESLCKSIERELSYVKEKQERVTMRRYIEAGDTAIWSLEYRVGYSGLRPVYVTRTGVYPNPAHVDA